MPWQCQKAHSEMLCTLALYSAYKKKTFFRILLLCETVTPALLNHEFTSSKHKQNLQSQPAIQPLFIMNTLWLHVAYSTSRLKSYVPRLQELHFIILSSYNSYGRWNK